MKSSNFKANDHFELGRLYAERGDFKSALEYLSNAKTLGYEEKSIQLYLKSIQYLLRIHAEAEDHEAIEQIKSELQTRVAKEKVEINSRTFYVLALCASYKNDQKLALDYLEKSLALALAADDKESICYAVSGIAIVYMSLGRFEDALKEIYNLKVFFQVLNLPELELSSSHLNGIILRRMGKPKEALEIFWQCFDMLRNHQNFSHQIYLLYSIGCTYMDLDELENARLYLRLAKRLADPERYKKRLRDIDEALRKVGDEQDRDFDLVFDIANKLVFERKKGRVEFGNQFILIDLLQLFAKSPGEVYSKETLVKKIWKQEYDPRVHDNKIYVTIKRLRELIEPDFEEPKYIFRAKNGYYLNRSTRVLVN